MSLSNGIFPQVRMRRLRANPKLQELIRQTELNLNDVILPLFVRYGKEVKNPISSMPGHYQLSIDKLTDEIKEIEKLGIPGVLLFGIPEKKDQQGKIALDPNGIIQTAVKTIKDISPNLLVITDVCFCEYTEHGHCGVISEKSGKWDVDNDQTLENLAAQAVSHAQAGADIVAPSCMMDGMVRAIRNGLNAAGFEHLPILSYAVKYCSALYGPFREAAEGAPKFGNRQTYQMDFANTKEALRECALDIEEGADMLMIKPGHAYLDIIYQVKQQFPHIPLSAYHVSGEYAMIKAAAEKNWINERAVATEILTSIKRAGADFIFTYFAKDLARWLHDD